jgi:NADH-quinone oxidoreductase subunit D
VLEVCEVIRLRVKEYNDLFTFNHSFMKRTAYLAVISPELARRCGTTGPNSRASGISFDLRKDYPYLDYQDLEFEVPLGKGEGGALGDVHDRFLVRLREIAQSMEILKQLLDNVPDDDFRNRDVGTDYMIPPGEAYVRIESSRGVLGCHVVSDGKKFPNRVQFRPPSFANLQAIPALVKGIRMEDLPLVLSSLDLGIAEADR